MRGEGARLWDAEGNEYLDFLCGISVTNLGHCHPRVVAAVREQVGRADARRATSSTPSPRCGWPSGCRELSLGGKVFFCNSGAEAERGGDQARAQGAPRAATIVVVLRRLPRAHLRRAVGDAAGVQAGAVRAARARLPRGRRRRRRRCAAAVDERTAAVLLEPIQGETGVHVLSDELLRPRARRCDEHGAALIFDEIQTGMGRTGTLWAYEQTGVVPDAMTVAKALGGGLPIGALDHRRAPRRRARARRPRLDLRRRPGRRARRAGGARA